MFRSKTAIIVGAGASNEVNLPVGEELKGIISQKIDIRFRNGFNQSSGCHQIVDALRKHARLTHGNDDINPYLHSSWKVRDALVVNRSIDNALFSLSHNELAETCGKLGIASSILEAEKNSQLYYNRINREDLHFEGIQNTWYLRFFNMLAEEISGSDVGNIFDNISFVSFNYDRCIEHFLYEALQKRFALDDQGSQELLAKLEILYPYGCIGELPWKNPDPNQHVAYGAERTDLLKVAKRIKTFNENFEDSPPIQKVRKSIAEAETLVFLGFAFHKKNMELISPNTVKNIKRVFATAHGISESDCRFLEREIKKSFQIDSENTFIEIRPGMVCADLFKEYWLSLTAS